MVVSPAHTGLPVEDVIPALRDALATGVAAVLTAAPGAGKTTVVPLRLLDEPWLSGGRIVVLEPRRVATRAAARRMAALLGDEVGGVVGYRTRDDRRVSERTRIEVVTDGILTRRLQADPELPGVGLVVFDEFHERSAQADLGLALALDVQRSLRTELRLLVMSATLDARRVASHLDAPVVASEGREHPVDIRWLPRRKEERLEPATAAAITRAVREEPGSVLAFLPGAGEIRRVEELVRAAPLDAATEVLPLYGALSAADQDAALAPAQGGRRKIVLATDIAETSLTVEGVRVVVDAGLARVARFDAGSGLTRLVTITASKASADQRAGRAGRLEPGTVYRLWSKVDHAARRPHLDPELTQIDLAGVALELAVWGATEPARVPFLDPPPARAFAEARALLTSLGALDAAGALTALGRSISTLPLHPRLGRMLVAAKADGDGWLACVLAALLEDRDVLRGPPAELPADVDIRLRLIDDPKLDYPGAAGRAIGAVRASARDLARRAGIDPAPIPFGRAGRVLALAYPDRLAQNRGGATPGRFKLRGGSGAFVAPSDVLSPEPWLVAADLDGHRRDARVRLGAPIDGDDVEELFGKEVTEHASVAWDRDRDDVVARVERVLGRLRLGTVERQAAPGPAVERLLRDRLRSSDLALLTWTSDATRLRARLAFLYRARPRDGWPDVSARAVAARVDLSAASSRRDLEAIDVESLLRAAVPPRLRRDLDRLAPADIECPNGRRVPVDYASDPPAVAVVVQDAFGMTSTPTVLDGDVRLVVHLLSPARRPIQVTSDLEGFWRGSWQAVRKEMAGRYPKHAWPAEPGAVGR